MARTPAQRGVTGNWLVERRLARGFDSQRKARAEIKRLTGWNIAQSVYAEWESGRRTPDDDNLARLREFWGSYPEAGTTATDSGAIVAAIQEQTRAIEKMTGFLSLLLERASDDRSRTAIVRQEIAEALGRIEQTLDLATSPAGTADAPPVDAPRKPRRPAAGAVSQ